MSQNGKRSDNGRESSGNKPVIIAAVVSVAVIVTLLVVIIIILIKNKSDNEPNQPVEPVATETTDSNRRDVLVTEDNVEEVIEQLEQEQFVAPGYYTVTQNYEWHFPSGSEESTDAHVENLPENTNDVYFDLFLQEDDENPIYQSPVIPLGAAIEHFKLDTDLDAGDYDCVMEYHLVDENQETISTVNVTVKVIVES